MYRDKKVSEHDKMLELLDEKNRESFLIKYYEYELGLTNKEFFAGYEIEQEKLKPIPFFPDTLEKEKKIILSELNFKFHIFCNHLEKYTIGIDEFQELYNEYCLVKQLNNFFVEVMKEQYIIPKEKSGIDCKYLGWDLKFLCKPKLKKQNDVVKKKVFKKYEMMLKEAFDLCKKESQNEKLSNVEGFIKKFNNSFFQLDAYIMKFNQQISWKFNHVNRSYKKNKLFAGKMKCRVCWNLVFTSVSIAILLLDKFLDKGSLSSIDCNSINDIYFTMVTLVFLLLSLTSVLSTKTNEIYWTDAIEQKLMNPYRFNFMFFTDALIIELLVSTIGFFLESRTIIYFSYIIVIFLLIVLTYKIINTFYGRDEMKLNLRQQFFDAKKQSNEAYRKNLSTLRIRTIQHALNLEETYVVENLQLFYDVGEIEETKELLIYIKNNIPDIFGDIFENIVITESAQYIELIYDVLIENLQRRNSNSNLMYFCLRFFAKIFLIDIVNELNFFEIDEIIKKDKENLYCYLEQKYFRKMFFSNRNLIWYRNKIIQQCIELERFDIVLEIHNFYRDIFKDKNELEIPEYKNDEDREKIISYVKEEIAQLLDSPISYGKDAEFIKEKCVSVIKESLSDKRLSNDNLCAVLEYVKNFNMERKEEISLVQDCMKAGYDIFDVYDFVDLENFYDDDGNVRIIPSGIDKNLLRNVRLAYLLSEPVWNEYGCNCENQEIENPYCN